MNKSLRRPTGRLFENRVWPVIAGYNLVAAYYQEWYWQSFWEANERPLIAEEIKKFQPHASPALDVGTGGGMYLREYARLSIKGVGLDASLAMLLQARKRIKSAGPFICGLIQQLPFAKETFNLVTACRVLTHVSELHCAFRELGRVTRAGGLLIISDLTSYHNYATVRIPTPEGDVHIETHKFTLEQLNDAAQSSCYWQVERVESIAYRNLIWKPEPDEFPSIDMSSGKPLFFYEILRRLPRGV